MTILNISAYKFVGLDDLESLRARIVERCEALALKGTVLLAPEGINLFLAAPRGAVEAFLAWLREDSRFADIVPKESLSDEVPFARMRVRLKKEIITMRAPAIRPAEGRAPHVLPTDLRRWLDQGHDDAGRPVVLLDTRNDYEVAAGTFENTVAYGLSSFTGFPAAVATAPMDDEPQHGSADWLAEAARDAGRDTSTSASRKKKTTAQESDF